MVDSFEWVERFIRRFGSPNLLYAVEVCGWHKDYAHALTFGRGIGVPDLEQAVRADSNLTHRADSNLTRDREPVIG